MNCRSLCWIAAWMLVATSAAEADAPAARVSGAGEVFITDPDGNNFAGSVFAIAARVEADGSAMGHVGFLLGESFSSVWGALPGVDFIRLEGKITAGKVHADGSVTLSGWLTEVDYSHGQGAVFEETNVPFEIVVSADGWQFTLQWCLLPVLDAEVTRGALNFK